MYFAEGWIYQDGKRRGPVKYTVYTKDEVNRLGLKLESAVFMGTRSEEDVVKYAARIGAKFIIEGERNATS